MCFWASARSGSPLPLPASTILKEISMSRQTLVIAAAALLAVGAGIALAAQQAGTAAEPAAYASGMTAELPAVGEMAPAFDLPSSTGKNIKLADYKGKTVVVYFYPKADTPGCTTEACGFRDSADEYKKAGVEIVGIKIGRASCRERV